MELPGNSVGVFVPVSYTHLMQMILCKEKLNLYMKGQDANLDEIYDRFGVDYNLPVSYTHLDVYKRQAL